MRATKAPIVKALKTARGQLDGILRMVEEDRYCIDISNQLLATQALLRKTNQAVLQAHLEHCVAESLRQGSDVDAKMEEIMLLLNKMTR